MEIKLRCGLSGLGYSIFRYGLVALRYKVKLNPSSRKGGLKYLRSPFCCNFLTAGLQNGGI